MLRTGCEAEGVETAANEVDVGGQGEERGAVPRAAEGAAQSAQGKAKTAAHALPALRPQNQLTRTLALPLRQWELAENILQLPTTVIPK